jgi:hypothetical protein
MALEKWLVDGPKVIDLELVRSVKIGLIGGKVDVIGHDEPGARVEVHSVSGKELKISIDGDTLEIDHPQLRWDNFIEVFTSFRGTAKADVSIMIPRDAALKFGVVSANALISGLTTDARVNSISGDIVMDDITGDLELNTVSGELSVSDHRGVLSAHSISGDVTVSGAVRRFSSDSVSGDVFLDLDGTPDEITNNTVSGSLTLRLDEGISTRYSLNTVSGTLQIDSSTIRGTYGKGFNHTTGKLEGSWTEVRANSVSGNITSVRRAPARTVPADAAPTDAPPAAPGGGAADRPADGPSAASADDVSGASE